MTNQTQNPQQSNSSPKQDDDSHTNSARAGERPQGGGGVQTDPDRAKQQRSQGIQKGNDSAPSGK